MAWNNEHIPKIIYEYDDESMLNSANKLAEFLDANDFGNAGNDIRAMASNADEAIEHATNKTVNETLKEVTDLMKERQYHSKSGYVGHGNMVKNTKDHQEGHKHEIYSDALAKDGYNYSQAFEFGLLARKYPAHHPFEDTYNHTRGLFEKNIDEVLERSSS